MLELIRNGGVPMWFVLLFGLTGLGAAIGFARKPDARGLRFVVGMGAATGFSVLSGTSAAIGAVCRSVPGNESWAHSPDLPLILLEGVGEAMAPGVLGFSLLSVTAFVAAVGLRRLPRA